MTIQLASSVQNCFPTLRLACLKVTGTQTSQQGQPNSSSASQFLIQECELAKLRWLNTEPSQIPVIAKWRARFKKFPTPKGSASSIENLIRRVRSGKFPPSISPLVDFANAISIKYGIPLGGEDLDKLVPFDECHLILKAATGNEEFTPLGHKDNSPECPLPKELIYADRQGVVCRALNWRESQRTCIQDDTTSAVFITEVIDTQEEEAAEAALAELGARIVQSCGGRVEFSWIEYKRNEV